MATHRRMKRFMPCLLRVIPRRLRNNVIAILRVVMARRLQDIDPKHNCRAETPGIFVGCFIRLQIAVTKCGAYICKSCVWQILCLIDWETDFCHTSGKSRLWCSITIVNRDCHGFAVWSRLCSKWVPKGIIIA